LVSGGRGGKANHNKRSSHFEFRERGTHWTLKRVLANPYLHKSERKPESRDKKREPQKTKMKKRLVRKKRRVAGPGWSNGRKRKNVHGPENEKKKRRQPP